MARLILSLVASAVLLVPHPMRAQGPPSLAPAGPPAARQAGSAPAAGILLALDFDFYLDRVEPILLSRRTGNARCVTCHSRGGGGNSYFEPLAPGATTYDAAQSRRNFERIQHLVVPGEPLQSALLLNPLAEEAGGSHWHGGGKHWTSQDAEEWQTLARWVRGRTN